MYWNIFDKKQVDLLKRLKFLKKYGFYLAGDTALALQIGHRTSLDFDFYTEKKFDSRKLREEFDKRFKTVQEIYIAQDTLELNVNDVGVSFFRYPNFWVLMFNIRLKKEVWEKAIFSLKIKEK
ncbi:MAG: nucleotidyl transferase AbiEii/AbiGii toxin family protein [Candidatus Omnitrophica bacterium]|nr:nucleotidyl transferase AbiEii/AbiGii toxin family protein [Candidatus Omnitrophota bacterium]